MPRTGGLLAGKIVVYPIPCHQIRFQFQFTMIISFSNENTDKKKRDFFNCRYGLCMYRRFDYANGMSRTLSNYTFLFFPLDSYSNQRKVNLKYCRHKSNTFDLIEPI